MCELKKSLEHAEIVYEYNDETYPIEDPRNAAPEIIGIKGFKMNHANNYNPETCTCCYKEFSGGYSGKTKTLWMECAKCYCRKECEDALSWCFSYMETFNLTEVSFDKKNSYYQSMKPFLNPVPYARPVKGMVFYSLVPEQRLPFTDESIEDLKSLCIKVFETTRFYSVNWCIESGKHKDKPNLHIHALCNFKNSKNFRRELIKKWNQVFDNDKYRIDWKSKKNCGIHMEPCNTLEIQSDKLNYMTNANKGEHENFTDLDTHGSWVLDD